METPEALNLPENTHFIALGINHWKAPVAIRENFSMNIKQQSLHLQMLRQRGVEAAMVISTCNRTEIYLKLPDPCALMPMLFEYRGFRKESFLQYGFVKHNFHAIRHLFRVSLGLDSQILGDQQIIHQVKTSYQLSVEYSLADSYLHRLMQHIFQAHKLAQSQTSLSRGAASIAYAAVQQLRTRLESLEDKRILLVGAGHIGKITCQNLVNSGVRNFVILNRNRTRAETLAARYHLKVADMARLQDEVAQADIVFVATGADQPILRAEHLPDDAQPRHLVDLSVPRNIDEDVRSVAGVSLINLDELHNITDEAFEQRRASIPQVERLIEKELSEFTAWLQLQKVTPTIKALKSHLNAIRDQEMHQHRHRFAEADLKKVDLLTSRIVNKIAAQSIQFLRSHPETDQATALVQAMFDLDLSEENV